MFLLAILLVVSTAAEQLLDKPYYDLDDAHNLFKNFVQEHGKIYDPEEYLHRLEVFKDNIKEINERNAVQPHTVYEVNRFADLTPEERVAGYGAGMTSEEIYKKAVELHYPPERITAPEQFDWRDHGVVTPVKSQLGCGSCWIFSAIGAIEGQYAIKYNKTLAFSVQQSLDCIVQGGTSRSNCAGGYPHQVMDYHEKFGVVLDEDYPYTAKVSTCHEDSTKVITKVMGYNIYKTDEETLKQLLYENGPLSVSLDDTDLMFNKKGIIYPHDCEHEPNHGVLLVGYGVENGTKYWILKNSFGANWAEDGYHRLERGVNACSMGTLYTLTCSVE